MIRFIWFYKKKLRFVQLIKFKSMAKKYICSFLLTNEIKNLQHYITNFS